MFSGCLKRIKIKNSEKYRYKSKLLGVPVFVQYNDKEKLSKMRHDTHLKIPMYNIIFMHVSYSTENLTHYSPAKKLMYHEMYEMEH